MQICTYVIATWPIFISSIHLFALKNSLCRGTYYLGSLWVKRFCLQSRPGLFTSSGQLIDSCSMYISKYEIEVVLGTGSRTNRKTNNVCPTRHLCWHLYFDLSPYLASIEARWTVFHLIRSLKKKRAKPFIVLSGISASTVPHTKARGSKDWLR